MTNQEKIAKYPKGQFARVVDTIGVPHPYCITPKHVGVASDHFGGMLGEAAIEDAERRGAKCGICHGNLSYAEHETAVLVAVDRECELADMPESDRVALSDYLKSIVKQCEEDGFAGFAFVKESVFKESNDKQ